MTNGEWMRSLILGGRKVEELSPFRRAMLANLEREIAAERDRSSTSEIHITIRIEPATDAPPGTPPATPPTE
jgi:hypothetical protein